MPEPRIVLADLFGRVQDLAVSWQPFRPGIEIARLYGNSEHGPAAALLRYTPGASVPRHEHTGFEHILVLQGEQSDERGSYPAGTCVIHAPGSAHAVHSEHGCVVLAIWEAPVRFT